MSNNKVNSNLVPNNNYKDCPALMSDGRFITNYKPNCEMNKNIERTFKNNVPMTSWEYKYHLTNKSDNILNNMDNDYNSIYGCSGYSGYDIPGPRLKQDCQLDNCIINKVNNNGIGIN